MNKRVKRLLCRDTILQRSKRIFASKCECLHNEKCMKIHAVYTVRLLSTMYNEITRKVIIHLPLFLSLLSSSLIIPRANMRCRGTCIYQTARARLFTYKCAYKISESHLLHFNILDTPFASFFFSSHWIAFSSRVMCPQKDRD